MEMVKCRFTLKGEIDPDLPPLTKLDPMV